MDNKVFLFPLTNAILFKKVTLPFHVFEPRYRQMVRDSLAMQIPIAIVSYHPSSLYRSEICVAGLPHILSAYPDGRMDIYITGTIKCRLTDLESDDPYKVYYYRLLEEDLSVDDSFIMELDSLRILLERWALHFLPDPIQRETFSSTLDDPELLVNYCTVFLVDDWDIKKEVMEADSLREKIKLLLQVIGPKEINLGPFMPTLKF
ncbi:MAG: LON peptidase substrate-binding domain-containing protein [Bacteriovoracaceae bacterium]|nr:LON peptidase substrate-binding domain-containing protein [Bacteriovoracaceae bacterium]